MPEPPISLRDVKGAGAAWITETQLAALVEAVEALPLIDQAASWAHDAIFAEPFDQQAANDAIWKIHNLARPLIARFSDLGEEASS